MENENPNKKHTHTFLKCAGGLFKDTIEHATMFKIQKCFLIKIKVISDPTCDFKYLL